VSPVHLSITVARPCEEVFEYLADIANHPEFTDHYLVDWRLTRRESYGRGAGARFRLKVPVHRFDWADVTLVEVEPPRRIVMTGRMGKFNRVGVHTTYTLDSSADSHTEVAFEVDTEPVFPSDRLIDKIGRPWFRRKAKKGLKRLRSILEEDRGRGARATVGGG
jgi:uncharacterized protein YndB with AHSA1/START domain